MQTAKTKKKLDKPVEDFLEYIKDNRSWLKTTKKPLSNDELHDLFAQAMADDYAKSLN